MKKEKHIRTKSERKTLRNKIIAFCILLIICIVWIFPMIYMVGQSFKSDADLMTHPESIFPSSASEWTLEHYSGFIIRDGQIDNMPFWMLNSLWSTLATVAITLILDLMTAFAMVFLKFKGKESIIKFLLIWMAVPGVIGTAPSYAMYAAIRAGMNMTEGAAIYSYIYMWIILPGTTGIFNMLLMRNFFLSIPNDIIASAKSDGAGCATIFFRIVVPLAKSTVMLIILFSFTGGWNALVWPQLLLSGENSHWSTVTVALSNTKSSTWGSVGVSMATSLFALLPILVIFLVTQNKMIDGLASTGVKG